jgi:prepilin peptidase CpaA
MNLETFAMHFACGFSVLVVSFAFFARGWMGGGDAKLAASIGLWFGFTQFLPFILLASILGGALTLALLSARQLPLPAFTLSQTWITRLHHENTGVPYGIALAAAAMIIYPETFSFIK